MQRTHTHTHTHTLHTVSTSIDSRTPLESHHHTKRSHLSLIHERLPFLYCSNILSSLLLQDSVNQTESYASQPTLPKGTPSVKTGLSLFKQHTFPLVSNTMDK